jgi:hypothetical protein
MIKVIVYVPLFCHRITKMLSAVAANNITKMLSQISEARRWDTKTMANGECKANMRTGGVLLGRNHWQAWFGRISPENALASAHKTSIAKGSLTGIRHRVPFSAKSGFRYDSASSAKTSPWQLRGAHQHPRTFPFNSDFAAANSA